MLVEINNINSPELEPFRDIRSKNWTQASGIFIAEGPLLVEAALQSDYQIQSVLFDRKYYQRFGHLLPEGALGLLVDHEKVEQIVGYNFHRGILACGLRKQEKHLSTDLEMRAADDETLVGIYGVQDPENLGAILRSCAALGVSRVLLGPGTADPLARRALRVSMGYSLLLDFYRTREVVSDLVRLKEGISILRIATDLSGDSLPLETTKRDGPVLILFGNERYGLPSEILENVDVHVRIDMTPPTDSLNVGVAAGIVLHHFTRAALAAKRQ